MTLNDEVRSLYAWVIPRTPGDPPTGVNELADYLS